jgi:superoxide reductase
MEAQKPKDPKNLSELEAKHWPQIEPYKARVGIKFSVKVKVGKTQHPMTPEHQIVFIEVYYGNKPIGKKFLKPAPKGVPSGGDKPEAEFEIMAEKPAKIIAFEFCNLHGLWQNDEKVG